MSEGERWRAQAPGFRPPIITVHRHTHDAHGRRRPHNTNASTQHEGTTHTTQERDRNEAPSGSQGHNEHITPPSTSRHEPHNANEARDTAQGPHGQKEAETVHVLGCLVLLSARENCTCARAPLSRVLRTASAAPHRRSPLAWRREWPVPSEAELLLLGRLEDAEGTHLLHFCNRIYVPNTLIKRALKWYYHYPCHPGGDILSSTLSQVCTWKGIVSQAQEH